MPNIFPPTPIPPIRLSRWDRSLIFPYLTEKEKAAYLPNYLEEGDFSDDGSIHIILTTSTKFLRIMEMASIELGGYEMRFDLNTVYVTKNFFPCSTSHLKMFPSFPPGISGDEFNLLFYGYQSQEEIRALLQNLSLAVSNTALELPSGRKLPASPFRRSFLVSGKQYRSVYAEKYADFAMYQVKKAEKGYITEFDLELLRKTQRKPRCAACSIKC